MELGGKPSQMKMLSNRKWLRKVILTRKLAFHHPPAEWRWQKKVNQPNRASAKIRRRSNRSANQSQPMLRKNITTFATWRLFFEVKFTIVSGAPFRSNWFPSGQLYMRVDENPKIVVNQMVVNPNQCVCFVDSSVVIFFGSFFLQIPRL